MDGVLNETTKTIHKQETGTSGIESECGATYHLPPDRLRLVSVEAARSDARVTKCGRCFDDGGGY